MEVADDAAGPWWHSPLVWASACWMVGIVIGREVDVGLWLWLGIAGAGAAASVAVLLAKGKATAYAASYPSPTAQRGERLGEGGSATPSLGICGGPVAKGGRIVDRSSRRRAGLVYGVAAVTVVAAAAGWWQVRVVDEAMMVGDPRGDAEAMLVEVEGVLAREPRHRAGAAGVMGRFDYRGPRTTLWVWVEDVSHGGNGLAPVDKVGAVGGHQAAPAPATGRIALLVSVNAYDDRLAVGDRVRMRGWLSGFTGPTNPGESDFRQVMAERRVVGRLSVASPASITIVDTAAAARLSPQGLLGRVRSGAERALYFGLPRLNDPAEPATHTPTPAATDLEPLALLEALLLGRRGGDAEELEDVFARTGLTHLLAISGLHLGILVMGTWWVVLMMTGRPRAALLVAVAVVLAYILLVPARVPVMRAGAMTLAALAALSGGRRISAMTTVSAAALGLLIWRPWDLFTAGFQLSFAVVVGLILFARPVSLWLLGLWGGSGLKPPGPLRRWPAGWLGVSLVAWCFAMPLVAWHFERVTPLAVLTVLALLPFVMAMLWLGYIKILLTAVWPAAGAWLGPPLWSLAEGAVSLVRYSERLPGATYEMGVVSGWWAIAVLGVLAATFGGWFAGRRPAMAASGGLLVLWFCFLPGGGPWANGLAEQWRGIDGLRLNMFSVGHGTAMVLRSGRETWIYDCGSHDYLDITTVAVGPALDRLGVRQIDTVVISHPHIDHFSGVPELVERYAVRRVVLPQQFIDDAEATDWSAHRYLLDYLRERNVTIETANAGWHDQLGHARVQAIWPEEGETFNNPNNASLVLRLEAAGRRVLLTGDVEDDAMRTLLDRNADLAADVSELPHHGAAAAMGKQWLEAVNPAVLVQSTNRRRLRDGAWHGRLEGIERHITARHGMIEVDIDAAGRIRTRRFHDGPQAYDEPLARRGTGGEADEMPQ